LVVVTGTNGAVARVTTDASIGANAAQVQPFGGNGPWYVCCGADANASTGVGILAVLLTKDAVFTLPQGQNSMNQLQMANYWILGSATSDSVIVSYWIA